MDKKTVAFHFEVGSKIMDKARCEMQTLYRMNNLAIANEVLGRNEICQGMR